MRSYSIIKRGVDWAIALPLLIVLSPGVVGILLLLLILTREAPLFAQPRVGYRERIFSLYKIKTMYSESVYAGNPWVKPVCLWLRQYSLDEVPQLWNILKGDMSLVGPRPLLVEYLPLYNADQRKRHQVKPGMSGWAQLQGRNLLPWPQRFALDIWYVEHQSLWLDMKIMFRTAVHLLRPHGVRPEGLVASEKFTGNNANP